MNKIAFVTDSVACLPAEHVQRYNIRVVPNIVIWSGKEYRDGVDITPSEVFVRLKTDKDFPTTAAVGPDVYERVFKELLADGFDILGISVSSKMSGTFHSAKQAKQTLGADNITVLDSNNMFMAEGWPLILAARAAEKGASLEECAAIAREGLANVGVVATVDSLEHAQRSGRIKSLQMYIGSLLNVKPMFEVIDGRVEPVGRVRTRQKSLVELVEMTAARVAGRSPLHLSVLHNDSEEEAQALMSMLQERLKLDESFVAEGSPIVAILTGPGSIAVSFMSGASTP